MYHFFPSITTTTPTAARAADAKKRVNLTTKLCASMKQLASSFCAQLKMKIEKYTPHGLNGTDYKLLGGKDSFRVTDLKQVGHFLW